MFRALVELGKELEAKGQLPPPGYYKPNEPIKWLGQITSNEILIVPTFLEEPRPYYGGRTSGVTPLLLADKANYSLGVEKNQLSQELTSKHESFIRLLEELILWNADENDSSFKSHISLLVYFLKNRQIRGDLSKIKSDDVVTFVSMEGLLFLRHPLAHSFWRKKLQQLTYTRDGKYPERRGVCSICNRVQNLVRVFPLQVKLQGTVAPLHSFNKAAFPSFVSSGSSYKKAHIGICFDCAEIASRAFNFLSQSSNYQKVLLYGDKSDALTNQIALYWVKAPAPLEAGEQVLDATNLSEMLAQILRDDAPRESPAKTAPRATLAQMESLLRLPWRPREAALRLDDYGFYLAVLSPNVGRIALREWIDTSLEGLKEYMARFLEATRIVSLWGDDPKPHSIAQLLQALESHNPNHLRGLLRTAYAGHLPPPGLKQVAVPVLRNARVLNDPKESWRHQALVALIKLTMFYGSKEAKSMEKLNPHRKHPAYLSGRLLAVLEEAQKRSQGYNINRTLVEKFYGAASTAPAATFGMLIRTAAVSHLQKAGSLNPLVEDIVASIDEAGGFPKTLSLEEQAEFALGFYHQRADFRAKSKEKHASEAEVNHE